VSAKISDRHLVGAGAAVCAACCAPPLLALLGIAGVGLAATLATLAFAGLAFGTVALPGPLFAVGARRRAVANACAPDRSIGGPCTEAIRRGAHRMWLPSRPPVADKIPPWTR
jgi:hypothetical protein